MNRRRPFAELTPPLVFAHRAGGGRWPENTALAFSNCQGLGALVLETDVRVTRDGQLVVFHDPRLERVTNGYGRVSAHALAELKELDAAYWFTTDDEHHPWRGTGQRILTVDELFAAFPQSYYNIELKAGAQAPALMWQAIERHRMLDRVLVAAADHALMRAFRVLSRGRVATSASRVEALGFLAAHALRATGTRQRPYHALQLPWEVHGCRLISRSLVEAAHRSHLQLHVWTVNEPAEMRRLLALGVDGIMSDYPDQLVRELRAGLGGPHSETFHSAPRPLDPT